MEPSFDNYVWVVNSTYNIGKVSLRRFYNFGIRYISLKTVWREIWTHLIIVESSINLTGFSKYWKR